ncbi:hypothetical protein RDWZM_008703 [Blomia tropicalis]|uniref:Uncharacterized protein n=1 Tax=Blomia tropicalis TaxID=40697 RepID=A0A9Q0M1T3_BLOTA|nr:hypothetical protein RDWZM_008703 [Blomia tropicalis]
MRDPSINVENILFDLSKQVTTTTVSVNRSTTNVNIQNECKLLQKRLKLKGYKIIINKEVLGGDLLKKCNLIIIFMPQLKYSQLEFSNLKSFLDNGGKVLILLEEGGERKSSSNVNYFMEEFGISINNDKVIRTSFYKYYNPKEVLIQDGILNRALFQQAAKLNGSNVSGKTLPYLYPFGATLNVAKPAVAILSTGSTSFPPCRPTCAVYENQSSGQMIVLGSGHVFMDKYLHKENNVLLLDLFMSYFNGGTFALNSIDSLNPEIVDYNMVPDLEVLCSNPMLILSESEDIPSDYTSLFSKEIKKISNRSLCRVNKAFEELQIEKRPLKVIKPHFETPFAPLQPAVFAPVFRALNKPELELYDLDEEFSSVPNKLTKLANKCNNDVDYFIRESGLILGLNLNFNQDVSKHILYSIASSIASYKRINDF